MAKKKTKIDADEPQEESDGTVAVNDAWTGMLAVSLLALVIGAGFLGYDYYRFSEDKVPGVTKFTSQPPGAPPKAAPPPAPKVDPNKDKDDKKDADKKDEKKDADKKDA